MELAWRELRLVRDLARLVRGQRTAAAVREQLPVRGAAMRTRVTSFLASDGNRRKNDPVSSIASARWVIFCHKSS